MTPATTDTLSGAPGGWAKNHGRVFDGLMDMVELSVLNYEVLAAFTADNDILVSLPHLQATGGRLLALSPLENDPVQVRSLGTFIRLAVFR